MTTTGRDLTHPAPEPFHLAALPLRNRLAVAPMTRVSATPDGRPTAQMVDHYRESASGGFGLITTEGIYTDTTHSQGYFNQPGLVTDQHVEGWQAVVEAVHSGGAAITAQLMHAGAISQGNSRGFQPIGPSAVRPRGQMMVDYGGAGGAWVCPERCRQAISTT